MDRIEYQQGLNSVVCAKVDGLISRKQQTVEQTMSRLISEGKIAQDFIAPIGIEQRYQGDRPVITFTADHHLMMNMPQGQFSLHSNAVCQLAAKMGVPAKYLRELSEGNEWQRSLAAKILNEHSGWTERSRVLIRSVGKEVRGVLSDCYRRLNSEQLLTAFLTQAINQGAVACDALMTDTKVFVETILPQPICIPTRLNGEVIIFMGARFSTSDYGDGAVDMRAFLLNGVCLDGMVRESVINKKHLGARLQEDQQFSDRTYKLDTLTMMSAVKDFTNNLFSPENIRQKCLEIEAASDTEIDLNAQLSRLVKGNILRKDEGEGVKELLMNNNPEDGVQGGPSLWKLTQAITAHARDLDPTRCRQLHEISGQLLSRASA